MIETWLRFLVRGFLYIGVFCEAVVSSNVWYISRRMPIPTTNSGTDTSEYIIWRCFGVLNLPGSSPSNMKNEQLEGIPGPRRTSRPVC